jgi:hypothetical protein
MQPVRHAFAPLSHLAISLHLLLLSKLKYEMVGTACACGVPSPQANFVSHSLTHSSAVVVGFGHQLAHAPPPPSPPAPAPALFFSSLFYLFIYLFTPFCLFRALLVFFGFSCFASIRYTATHPSSSTRTRSSPLHSIVSIQRMQEFVFFFKEKGEEGRDHACKQSRTRDVCVVRCAQATKPSNTSGIKFDMRTIAS